MNESQAGEYQKVESIINGQFSQWIMYVSVRVYMCFHQSQIADFCWGKKSTKIYVKCILYLELLSYCQIIRVVSVGLCLHIMNSGVQKIEIG